MRADAEPGTILHNLVQVEDATPRVARTSEDTLITGPRVLSLTIDDLPDPVGPMQELEYAISFANVSGDPLNGAVIHAEPDPNLVLKETSPPADGDLFWNIGTMAGTSAGRVFATFTINPTMPNLLVDGTLLPFRAWIVDADGNQASAAETTLFRTESGPDSPYKLNLTGAPRNLRTGVVETAVFGIKLSHEGAVATEGVVVNLAALRMPADARLFPNAVPAAGLFACIVLAFSLPLQSIAVCVGLLACGFLLRRLLRSQHTRREVRDN